MTTFIPGPHDEGRLGDPSDRSALATDKYDALPTDPRRIGQHRAVLKEPAAGYRRLVAAGVGALLIGLFCASALPLLGFVPKAAQAPAASSNVHEVPLPAPEVTSSANPALRRHTVDVYNASGVESRTTDVTAQLASKGWVIGALGMWGGQPPARTTVYYGDASLKDSAALLGEDLGGAEVAEDQKIGKALRVVVSGGYAAG